MRVNGWDLFSFHLFTETLDKLVKDVVALKEKDPSEYKHHPKTKLLKRVFISITETVPQDPNHSRFTLGKFLGEHNKNWRRVKKGLPQRFRLFFRFSTKDSSIIYVWLNDTSTFRKKGSKTDVYNVFKWLIGNGKVANSYAELKAAATELKVDV